jgi:hypothetical protein
MKRHRLFILGLLLAVALDGCAPRGTTGTRSGSRSTTLTQEQLASANSDNLYDAIVKLRPEWLTTRGPSSVTDIAPASADVYMAGSMLGKTEYLKEVRLADVSEVRYWDAGSASARFGMGHPRGVIEITRK